MRLRYRISRLEELMDRRRSQEGEVGEPRLIRIRGGLGQCEPLYAKIRDLTIRCEQHETETEFQDRAIAIGIERHAAFVIVGGMPPWPH
jgi:hypothetical protein